MLVGGKYRERYWLWVLVGLSLGVACLFKSFALVAPAGLALTWSVLVARRYQRLAFLRFDVPRILLASFVALVCFAIWPALDPEPAEILQHFVLEENVGKLGGDGYLRGRFFGPYPLSIVCGSGIWRMRACSRSRSSTSSSSAFEIARA